MLDVNKSNLLPADAVAEVPTVSWLLTTMSCRKEIAILNYIYATFVINTLISLFEGADVNEIVTTAVDVLTTSA